MTHDLQFERDYIAAARRVRAFHFAKYRENAPAIAQITPRSQQHDASSIGVIEQEQEAGRRGARASARARQPTKRKNAPGASISLSMRQVRLMVESGKTSKEIAAVAGCSREIIDKMRQKLGIARPCVDCNEPTGRWYTALYCLPCSRKRDAKSRVDAEHRRRERVRLSELELAGSVEQRWGEMQEAQA